MPGVRERVVAHEQHVVQAHVPQLVPPLGQGADQPLGIAALPP